RRAAARRRGPRGLVPGAAPGRRRGGTSPAGMLIGNLGSRTTIGGRLAGLSPDSAAFSVGWRTTQAPKEGTHAAEAPRTYSVRGVRFHSDRASRRHSDHHRNSRGRTSSLTQPAYEGSGQND